MLTNSIWTFHLIWIALLICLSIEVFSKDTSNTNCWWRFALYKTPPDPPTSAELSVIVVGLFSKIASIAFLFSSSLPLRFFSSSTTLFSFLNLCQNVHNHFTLFSIGGPLPPGYWYFDFNSCDVFQLYPSSSTRSLNLIGCCPQVLMKVRLTVSIKEMNVAFGTRHLRDNVSE